MYCDLQAQSPLMIGGSAQKQALSLASLLQKGRRFFLIHASLLPAAVARKNDEDKYKMTLNFNI
jgi:hypothetical protein